MKRVLWFLLSICCILWVSQAYTQAQVTTAIDQVMDRYDASTQLEKLNEVIPRLWGLQLSNPAPETFLLLKKIETAVRDRIDEVLSSQVTLDTDPPTALEQELYEDMNRRRQQRWLATMSYSNALAQAAQILADDMAAQDFFDHINPQWVGYVQRLWLVGYEFSYVSENLAKWNITPMEVNQLWTDSPTHEVNLYNTQSIQVWVWYEPTGHHRVAVYAKPL